MARVTLIENFDDWYQWEAESEEDFQARTQTMLQNLESEAGEEGLVGRVVVFGARDGQAYYRVVEEAPLRLEFIPAFGGHTLWAAEERNLTLENVAGALLS